MKKVIAIAVLFISAVGFSQIKVLETVPVEKLGRVNNSFYVQKIGDEFTFFYTTVQSASPLNDVKLELPNNFVWLHYILSSDKTTVQFMVSSKEAGSTHISEPLSKEQVDKLFQKS